MIRDRSKSVRGALTFFWVILALFAFFGGVQGCRTKIGIYWDSDCLYPVECIDWGLMNLGDSRSVEVFVRNEGDVSVVLGLNTKHWSPGMLRDHSHVDWNYSGVDVPRDHVVSLALTLFFNLSVSGVGNFTFDIIVSATDGVTVFYEIPSAGSILQYRVHNLDTQLSYLTIQGAINAEETVEGHRILVDEGVFSEHVHVNKPVVLMGENRTSTIMVGDGAGVALNITSSGVTVKEFTVQNYAVGLLVHQSSDNIIVNNTFYDNVNSVQLVSGSNNTVAHNMLTQSSKQNLALLRSSHNVILANIIQDSHETGLLLSNSYNNSFTSNSVTTNMKYGVLLNGSSNNELYHNNFVNNTCQVFDVSLNDSHIPPSVNTWCKGYPEGGAYWSDYDGVDLYTGPSQSEQGSDNLGDISYTIDLNNNDTYPLMGPFGSWTMSGVNSTVFPTAQVSLQFEDVMSEGFTTVDRTLVGPPTPSGLQLMGEYFDIRTTVAYSGSVMIRIIYDDSNMTLDEEMTLKLFQWNDTSLEWVNITLRVDDESNVIYGQTIHLSIFGVTRAPVKPYLDATIQIRPEVLNLRSRGREVIAHIELSSEYNLSDIDVSTIRLNSTVTVDPAASAEIGDVDGDSVPDLTVAFNKTDIVQYIQSQGVEYANISLTLTGELRTRPYAMSFKATDTILVSDLLGDVNCDGAVTIYDIVEASISCSVGAEAAYWNSNANFAPSWSRLDIFDLVTIAYHFGEKHQQ